MYTVNLTIEKTYSSIITVGLLKLWIRFSSSYCNVAWIGETILWKNYFIKNNVKTRAFNWLLFWQNYEHLWNPFNTRNLIQKTFQYIALDSDNFLSKMDLANPILSISTFFYNDRNMIWMLHSICIISGLAYNLHVGQ